MAVKTVVPVAPGTTYVEWSTIIAGSVLALSLSLILLKFGALIGLEVFEPTQSGDKTMWMVIAAGLWLFWVQLMSSMAGGYLAGRLRAPLLDVGRNEAEVRDGAHGLLVWGTSTLVIAGGAAVLSALAALGAEPSPAVQQQAEVAEAITRRSGIIFGFGAAAGSLVSAVAAWWMGTVGGDHRSTSRRFLTFN